MRRIVVVSNGIAGAKAAARIKRLAPEAEVNLVTTNGVEVDEAAKSGPFAALTKHRDISNTLMEAKQVGVIEADEFSVDFEGKELVISTDRGTLPVRFSELVMEVDASPRLPRAFRQAGNLIPWPLERGELVESLLNEGKPESAVVLGSGFAALELIQPLLERNLDVTWVRCENGELDADMWQYVQSAMAACNNEQLNVLDWTNVSPEQMVPVFDDDGLVTSMQDGKGNVVAGDVFFWTQPLRALHPVIAQEGVDMEPVSGLIAVDGDFQTGQDGLYLFGSAVAVSRGVEAGDNAPKGALYGVESSVAMARVVADSLCGMPSDWKGASGSSRMSIPGGVVWRAGLSLNEISSAGLEPEFVILKGSPALALSEGEAIVKLLCDKNSRKLLGVQVIAPEHGLWADAVASAATVALSSGMSVDSLATMDLTGGGELLVRAAGMLVNKLQYRVLGITPDELLASKEAGAEFFMLDLRDQIAWKNGHIPEAHNIPFTQLKERLQDEVPRFTPLVLISRNSDVAYSVACMLAGLGASSLYVLDGGMDLWPYDTAVV